MRKLSGVLGLLLILVTGTLSAQQMNLGAAITRAAREVEEVLPQRTMVAVLNVASPSNAFSDYVIEELTGELVNGKKVTIVDRRNLAFIRRLLALTDARKPLPGKG